MTTKNPPVRKGKDLAGPPHWAVMHFDAASYDGSSEQAIAYVNLVKAIAVLFPCKMCRENMNRHLSILPVDKYLDSKHNLFFWSYTLHDLVNKDHNVHKPQNPPKISPPYDDMKAFYFKALDDECKDCKTY